MKGVRVPLAAGLVSPTEDFLPTTRVVQEYVRILTLSVDGLWVFADRRIRRGIFVLSPSHFDSASHSFSLVCHRAPSPVKRWLCGDRLGPRTLGNWGFKQTVASRLPHQPLPQASDIRCSYSKGVTRARLLYCYRRTTDANRPLRLLRETPVQVQPAAASRLCMTSPLGEG